MQRGNTMSRQLMEIVLPRLARPLHRQLERYQLGEMSEAQFTRRFERVLQRQHDWLSKRGIKEARAAVAIHAAVIILSQPGLRAEAFDHQLPFEVIENRAIGEASQDVAASYGQDRRRAADAIARLVARHGE
jgi:hypothetical protein